MGNDQSSAPKDGDGVSTSQQVRESSKNFTSSLGLEITVSNSNG